MIVLYNLHGYAVCYQGMHWYNFNSYPPPPPPPPSVSDMHTWIWPALVQIMACRLFSVKPLSKPMLGYCQLDHLEQTSWNVDQNTTLFIHENTYENIVCEMTAIVSRGDECKKEINFITFLFVSWLETISIITHKRNNESYIYWSLPGLGHRVFISR